MSTPDPRDDDLGRLAALHSLRQSGGYKGTTLVLSLLVLTMVIGMAVLVAIRGDGDESSTQPPQVTATDTPTSLPPQTPVTRLPDDAFGVPTTDTRGRRVETPTNPLGQVLPQTTDPSDTDDPEAVLPPPRGLMWQRVYGATIPFSTSDGPTAISTDGVPTGFAHTPQGAALAAWQIGQRATWAPDDQNVALLDRAAVVSEAARPEADNLRTNGAQIYAGNTELPAQIRDVPVAVRVTTYSTDFAHVEFAQPLTRDDGFTAISVGVDMVWRDGQWKWVVPEPGNEPSRLLISTTGDGWTPW
ncbi:hypothetical protein JTZ10_22405 [Gordonia rubripertincta]|uniref:DUF8175 domain-containing protein n=1 Tax=Gordonia rubripertincta TaxID=36822 RepID=A0AAW4GB04_GORRU|nr:hypothetical protein [Gordonia rubripertincta]MBM7280503.1 hypothetical protein [Gordonia rubripertincta]QMU23524.1 hypothetical protein H3V45_23725 [Gordonia rubripertincta]